MKDKDQIVNGTRIQEARELRGLSQVTLSEMIDVQRQTVSAYEKIALNLP
jgi:DNA-binding XRE family transcriptional regulator